MLNKKIVIPILICCSVAVLWSCVSSGSTPRHLFIQAETCYKALRNSSEKQKYRSYWLGCIHKFEAVYQQNQSGPWAAAGLYNMGRLYADLYKHSFKQGDRDKAKELFEKVVEKYPDSAYCQKAKAELQSDIKSLILNSKSTLAKKSSQKKVAVGPKKIQQVKSKPVKNQKGKQSEIAIITGIRYWSNPEYTRVVIDADRETSFQNNLLKKDPSVDKLHQRLYIDLKNSRLGDVKKTIPINDSLLKTARAGQYNRNTVRVVIDIKSFEDYNVFSLKNPFRIVIDVRGKSVKKAVVSKGGTPGTASIARQLALGVHRIIIDPGHGGKDYGAPGYFKGVHEKTVVLQIAKRLAEKIKRDLGCDAFLTRSSDKYLALEERTAIANTKRADLFISIHANASRNKRASGIETYFLNLTTDDESISVAARENATSEKNISELQTILNDLMRNAKINESSRLAASVQRSLFKSISKKYNRVRNKGVKRAPFYVLIGAHMPAILIETSFISNKTECRRLTDKKYQETLCDGIVNGIREYMEEIRPAAYIQMPLEKSRGS